MKIRTVLIVGAMLAAGGVSAATWYVDDANGNDSNDGSASRPFKTIGKALDIESDVLKDGEIIVKPGRYHLNGTPLVKNRYCTLRSESGNPTDTIIDADGLSECARFVGADGEKLKKPMRVIGFTFTNGAKPKGNGSVACCLNADSNVIVSNCVVTGNIESEGKELKYPPVYVKKARMVDCVISNNVISGYASAVQLGTNGVFQSGLITENRVTTGIGAAVYAYTGGILENTVVSNNVSPVNSCLLGTPQMVSGCLFTDGLSTIGSVRICGAVSIYDYENKGCPDVCLLTNCTIRGNSVENSGYASCAGVRIDGVSCTLVDCVISNNISRQYTGIYAPDTDKNVLISSCRIEGNSAVDASKGNGGGAYFGNGIVVTNSVFHMNSAEKVGGGVYGAGFTMIDCVVSNNTSSVGGGVCVCTNGVAPAVISGTFFSENHATYAGGGLAIGYEQKESTSNTNGYAIVTDCIFTDNSTDASDTDFPGGGGVYLTTGSKSSGMFDRCVFKGNTSKRYGGAFSTRDAAATPAGTEPTVVRNSLFLNNSSSGWENKSLCVGGALYLVKSDPMIVENCTFNDNTVDNGGTNSDVHIRWGGVCVRNCIFNTPNVESRTENSSYATNCFRCDSLPEKVQSNLGNFVVSDVKFSDPANGDWSLSRFSPCINAAALLEWMTKDSMDVAGGKRVSSAGPDLGAYEYQFPFGLRMVFR